jgi:calcium-translocating P-type ATPase
MAVDIKQIRSFEGLSDEDVKQSRLKYGSNQITKAKSKSFLKQYLESFGDPTIKILMIALLLNVIIFIKNFNWYESIGIAVSIILSTLVSTISEYGSQLAFEKLMEDAKKLKCKVWRKNDLIELPIEEIVVGDWVKLQPGDKIPADGVLIDGYVDIDQSTLNGESEEVHKKPIANIGHINMSGKSLSNPHMLFSGSIVCQGEGILLVQTVGDNTFYGSLAKELQEEKQESPLKKRLSDLAVTISRFGYLGAILVFFASLFNSIVIENAFNINNMIQYVHTPFILIQDILRAVIFAVTVIVVAVPEGLPLMITVVLSSNMRRMIKDNVLVRKLVGIETAGSISILFTDKTGTLTTGKLKLNSIITGDNTEFDSSYLLKENRGFWKIFYTSSVFNNSSQISNEGNRRTVVGGNSTDRSILEFAAHHPVDTIDIRKHGGIAFKSENKYSVTNISGEFNLSLIKGAPEKILPYCTKYYDLNGNKKEFKNIFLINKRIKELSSKGIRVIVLATSDVYMKEEQKFSNLSLVGVVAIKDEIRKNVSDSLNMAKKAGVQVIMITGDAKDTAQAVAIELGLIDDNDKNAVVTSEELNQMSDEWVKKLLPTIRVVARSLPSDKSRLVKLAQELDLVVGMTGDGVNDAPALKKADVGFAMGSGTEIAKEASDIIIIDDNFLSITKAILYGRTIFKSIRKFIIFQLSINVFAVGISVIGQFIGIDAPITVIQMLWVNMVMDTLAGLAFAGEAALPEYMEEKPKKRDEKIINKYMASQIFFTGLYTTVMSIAFLKCPAIKDLFRTAADNRYLLTGFFAFFMFSAIFNSLNSRTQRLNLFSHIMNNKAFISIMTMVVAIQTVLIYYGKSVFRAYGLTFSELRIVILFAFLIIPIDLMRKSVLRMRATKDEIGKFL